jgi:hypothetical protein
MWLSTSTLGLTATETVVDYPRNDLFEPIILMQAIKCCHEPDPLADVLLIFVTPECGCED